VSEAVLQSVKNTDYFPLLLFLPAAIFSIAAMVAADNRKTKRRFLHSALVFIGLLVFFLPLRFWRDLFNWLFHHSS
jgi:uncharacterized membrane protein